MLKAYHTPRTGFIKTSICRKSFPLYLLSALLFLFVLISDGSMVTRMMSEWYPNRPAVYYTQEEVKTQSKKPHKFHLDVPFYVYADNDLLDWSNMTIGGKPYHPVYPSGHSDDGKHVDDYWLMRAALKHPMRTVNPEEAQLFFVPVLLNVLVQYSGYEVGFMYRKGLWTQHGILCVNGNENCYERGQGKELIKEINQALGLSPYFRRKNGKDHVIVTSHWLSRYYPKGMKNIFSCNSLHFENERVIPKMKKKRVRMPGFYTGSGCPISKKTEDVVLVASLNKFKSRREICDWVKKRASLDKSQLGAGGKKLMVRNCGTGNQCPALSEARHGFHVKGDTFGSNRLMDTIMSRTIPIFTDKRQYDILPSFIPWRNMSYMIDTSDLGASLEPILYDEDEYQKKMKVLLDWLHVFDQTQPYQFDLIMKEFSKRIQSLH